MLFVASPDVTNRSRAQSVENSIWRKKLSFTSANISDNSTPTPNLNCSQEQKLSSPHTNDVKDLNPNIPLMNKRKNKNFINTNTTTTKWEILWEYFGRK